MNEFMYKSTVKEQETISLSKLDNNCMCVIMKVVQTFDFPNNKCMVMSPTDSFF